MQQLADSDVQTERVGVRLQRKRKTSLRRKVTVRLSESVCGRLDVATDRPGVGKSMLVEAALEHFLNPAPSVEALVQARFDEMQARFDRFEHDMRMMTETVALHARYQLAVTPPVPQERQREAILLGDERFKVLAEQVDRRLRQRRPLLQETIDRLNCKDPGRPGQATGEQAPHNSQPQQNEQKADSEHAEIARASRLAAGEVGRNSHAHHRPVDTADPHDASLGAEQDQRSIPPKSGARPREEPEASGKTSLSNWRLIFSVFLPFAAGYFLSFLFRTINASISPALVHEFGLDASKTGLLAAVYFLVVAGAQLPLGMFLDHYGPRRVQSVMLVIAVGGATLFGTADGFAELLAGRAMIGLGVATALMAGLKAIVTWFPKERIALVNGWMIMLGSLGAVTATAPTDWLLNFIGWRSLFEILTGATLATAGLIFFAVPERDTSPQPSATELAEPAIGEVHQHFTTEQSLRTNRKDISHDQHPDHQFRIDRWATHRRIVRCKFAAEPGQIERCVDPPSQVIVRHRIFEVKLVEKLTLLALQTAHHGSTSPRIASTQRNHASRPVSTIFATKSARSRHYAVQQLIAPIGVMHC